jgi:23S rRNA (adenine2503-C2)-methyltransferase
MPAFRAAQILEWVYEKGVCEPERMSNLSKLDRAVLARDMTFLSGSVISHQRASDGTQKLLIEWTDYEGKSASALADATSATAASNSGTGTERDPGLRPPTMDATPRVGGSVSLPLLGGAAGDSTRQTECVMIPSLERDGPPGAQGRPTRRTACISSQIGCPVGCKFCASGLGGLDGNLSAGRIIEQVWRLGQLPDVGRITNVVFMGMGEPLSNFANVTRAIRTLASLWATGISARKITISTVGLPKAIERLAEQFELPVTLALSLHAPTDDIRRSLIPWAEYTTIDELLAACRKWFAKTGREITLEYTLLRDVNDRPAHAEHLSKLAKQLRANVNLIRYNEVGGIEFKRPRTDDVLEFQKILKRNNVNTHIRASRGRDIAAACGQLRHEKSGAAVAAPAPVTIADPDDAGGSDVE